MSMVKNFLMGFVLLLGIGGLFFVFQKQTWLSLTVDNGHGQERLRIAYLPENSRFCVRFKHSVALTPVEEWFVAENGQVSLRSTVYEDFGAGLPHDAHNGREMSVQDGKIVITGYTLNMHAMYVRVGRIAEHELIIEKEQGKQSYKLRLDSIVKPGKAVKVSILKDSFAHVLWRNWNIVEL